jgi:hypothetical protein
VQGKVWISWEALLPGHLNLARVKQAQADWSGAFAALDEMVTLARNAIPAAPVSAESMRAWLWLRQGCFENVERWAHGLGLQVQQDITYNSENG